MRFDLYGPTTGGTIEVILEEVGNSSNRKTQTITLEDAIGPYDLGYNNADIYKLGYARTGFETFHIDEFDSLRGKAVTLRFQSNGGTAYLDNVFFKSENLLLGNLSNARSPQLEFDPNNYLIERPQYSLSFNNTTKAPNWVSWQLNETWMGNVPRPSGDPLVVYPWLRDPSLPIGLESGDPYAYLGTGFVRGHMTPVADRDRTQKDVLSTFFTSNALAQAPRNNGGPWQRLEEYAQDVLVSQGKQELYIISGGYNYQNLTKLNGNDTGVDYPEHIWKVIVVLEPGATIADITSETRVIVIDTPNNDSVQGTWWDDPNYLISLRTLESRLHAAGQNINFLSNISGDIQGLDFRLIGKKRGASACTESPERGR